MSEQRYCVLDYETRSEVDLKKFGGFEYADHESTQILCASWRVGTRTELARDLRTGSRPRIWSPFLKGFTGIPHDLVEQFFDPTVIVIAHNAFFEQAITRCVLSRRISDPDEQMGLATLPHHRWVCTASMARALALPGNLEGACAALKLDIQKDMTGRRLMMKYCKPRKPTKNNPARWHKSARDLKRIMEYCQNDVDAETALFLALPPLNPTERKVWLLDQRINFRGFAVDRDLTEKALCLIDEETRVLNNETKDLTGLASTNRRAAVLEWLESEGVFLPDLKAKTVSDALKNGLATGKTARVLEIRQAISKTSTAKYAAFERRSRVDGRARDTQVYHTASTGRWGGAGIQPQNFPRGDQTIDTDTAADVLKTGDLEWVRALYGHPMNVLSSCLRSVIVAPEGTELFCADYAAIEARALFWVAGHTAGIKAFAEDRPVYEEMAQVIYNINYIINVTKLQRQVGKQAFLGCGYGMGWKKFLQTCINFGIEIDEGTAQVAVQAYRGTHYPVVKLWSNLEKAAIAVTQKPGLKLKVNRTVWWVEKSILWCELPSARRLAYFGPEIHYHDTPWGEKRPTLYHQGVNPLSRKWGLASTYGGRLCENVVQAVARDLLAEAMLRIEDADYQIVLTVHDEILAERQKGLGSVDKFEKLMGTLPAWAEGFPMKVEGWSGPRYRK